MLAYKRYAALRFFFAGDKMLKYFVNTNIFDVLIIIIGILLAVVLFIFTWAACKLSSDADDITEKLYQNYLRSQNGK